MTKNSVNNLQRAACLRHNAATATISTQVGFPAKCVHFHPVHISIPRDLGVALSVAISIEETMESTDIAAGGDDNVIREGKTKILKNKDVFYNKVQEFNRDLRYVSFCLFTPLLS